MSTRNQRVHTQLKRLRPKILKMRDEGYTFNALYDSLHESHGLTVAKQTFIYHVKMMVKNEEVETLAKENKELKAAIQQLNRNLDQEVEKRVQDRVFEAGVRFANRQAIAGRQAVAG